MFPTKPDERPGRRNARRGQKPRLSVLFVRVTAEEKQAIEAAAWAAGMSVANWARRVLLSAAGVADVWEEP